MEPEFKGELNQEFATENVRNVCENVDDAMIKISRVFLVIK